MRHRYIYMMYIYIYIYILKRQATKICWPVLIH